MSRVTYIGRHYLHRCDRDGCCNPDHGCQFCLGGLALCLMCGGAEAALPTHCPGIRISEEGLTEIMDGTIDYNVHKGWFETGSRPLSQQEIGILPPCDSPEDAS